MAEAAAPIVAREPSLEESDAEQQLWTCSEVYVYQIPPLKNESGHRANDWDVNKWLWSGKMQVVSQGKTVLVRLIDPKTGELFATCPQTEPNSKAIDAVVDSSRYFVLRIDDGKGRHAFIGMGFRDRSDSYDFNATLMDHWKGVSRQAEADALRHEQEARAATEPLRDLSLKDGETLSIKVNVPHKGDRPSRVRGAASGGTGLLPPPPGPGLLAPPPPAAAATIAPPPPAVAAPAAAAAAADDFGDFGDFSSAGGGGDDDGFGDFSSG